VTQYLQTSTANPYGHRPWATALYTGFEDYAFLKQPQNRIIREDVNMRPEIYRPPEMKSAAALGDCTLVGGSGKILHRARARRRGTLGMISPIQMSNGGTRPLPLPGPLPVWRPPSVIKILPPGIVPPVPQPIYAGPGGTIYVLPGNATTPGSPFAPADPSQLQPGAIPITTAPAAAAAADAAATPAPTSSFSNWFNAQDYVGGIPNGYVALGGAFVVYLFTKKKR
jgi:hypothetical protein